MPEETLIELRDISFSYPGMEPVLDGLNFTIKKGERLGLIGPNGSGKSTLLQLMMGLIKPTSGTVHLFGKLMQGEKDFLKMRTQLGFVFQNADDQLFSPTVLEDVAFGPLNMGKKPDEAIDMSRATLKALGLESFEKRITYKLSGGEKKLVSFATVLVMQPKILLLDEPTTGLDEKTVERMIQILNDLDIGYLTVSHEFDFLAKTTASIFCMESGKTRFSCSADEFSRLHNKTPVNTLTGKKKEQNA